MPATPTDRLNGLTTSVAVKPACRVATTANITLSGLQAIDGVTVAAGDRVLVKNQTAASDNGIYEADTSAWSRAPDFDGARDAVNGTLVIVRSGATNSRTIWELTSSDPVHIGIDALTFEPAVLEDSATAVFLQAGTGAVQRTAQEKLREPWVTPQDYMTAAQKADVAARTRLVDVTDAIQKAFATSKNVMFPPGDYRITMTEGAVTSVPLVSLTSQNDIQVLGFGANLYDPHVYTVTNVLHPVFQLTTCKRAKFLGLNYIGVPLASPDAAGTGIGYNGAAFMDLLQGCEDIEVDAYLQDLRYGVKSGNYPVPADGYNKHLRLNLRTLRCGYPQAHYLAEDVTAQIYAENSHRSSYLAGANKFDLDVRVKNQHIAPVQVLLSDATTNNGTYPTGTSRGCTAGRVRVVDMGSTTYPANSWLAGISLSRVDPGTTFEDIEFELYVLGTDTVASSVGAFLINSSATAFATSYPFDWEQSIMFKRIKVSGLVDRSAQTVAGHGIGDFYINMLASGAHYGTIQGLDIDNLRCIPSAGSNANLYCDVPGLRDQVNVRGCDFGTYPLAFKSSSGKPFNWIDCAPITKTLPNSSDTTVHNFRNTDVTEIGQPVTNAYFDQAAFMGASAKLRTLVRDVTLTGASVTLTAMIPPGALVLGVSGRVKTAITGATGYQVGVSGDLARFADRFTTALNDTFTPQMSATTEVGSRYYRVFTDIVVTAKTSNFTGGSLRVAVQYFDFTAPT